MHGRKDVYIEGVALEISWRDASRSLTELIFDTVSKFLRLCSSFQVVAPGESS